MKKYLLLTTFASILLLSSCVLGGIIEANQLEGTWVSDNAYKATSRSYYAYYEFNSISVDLDGDQSGTYIIRGYSNNNDWWGGSFDTFESGHYATDFISGRITIMPYSGGNRYLEYSLTDNTLVLTDIDWWTSTSMTLRKLN